MAEWHLKDLRNAMGKSGWRFVAEHGSDDDHMPTSWEFERDGNEHKLFVDFDVHDDLRKLPTVESYGCQMRGDNTRSLYFSRKGQKGSTRREIWQKELMRFVASLDEAK